MRRFGRKVLLLRPRKQQLKNLLLGKQYTITVSSNGTNYACDGKIAYLDAFGQHGLLLVEESKYQKRLLSLTYC
jgi:hypothetical protein